MARAKTTRASIKSARFNPDTSAEDAEALRLITELQAQGFTVKDIFLEGLRKGCNLKPVKTNGEPNMQALLERFAQEIIAEIRKSGIRGAAEPDETPIDDEGVTPFMKNFARSFVQRQQRAGEDEG